MTGASTLELKTGVMNGKNGHLHDSHHREKQSYDNTAFHDAWKYAFWSDKTFQLWWVFYFFCTFYHCMSLTFVCIWKYSVCSLSEYNEKLRKRMCDRRIVYKVRNFLHNVIAALVLLPYWQDITLWKSGWCGTKSCPRVKNYLSGLVNINIKVKAGAIRRWCKDDACKCIKSVSTIESVNMCMDSYKINWK